MTDPHAQAMRQVARGGTINLVGAGVAAVFGFLLTWVVARGASLTDAGVFFATTSLFLILVAIAEAGGDASLPRFVPLLRARTEQQRIPPVIRLATVLALGVGTVVGIALLLGHGQLNRLLGLQETGELDSWVLVSTAVAVPLTALANVLLAATRGYFSIRATVLVDKIGRTLAQFGLVAAAVWVGSLGLMIEAWIVPMALAVVPAAWLLRRLMRADGPPAAARPATTADEPAEAIGREYLRYTWPRAVSRLLQMVLQRADVVVVAAILSPAEAAIYAVATRLIVLGQTAAMSLGQVLAPRIAHLIEDADYRAAMDVARTAAAWTVLLCWPLYLLSISAGPLLLTMLGGADYVPGWAALSILAAGMLIASATGPVDTVLLMAGRSALSLGNMVVAVVVDLVLLFVLTPQWGIVGAAVAWSTALVLRSLLGVWFVRRITGITALGQPSALAVAATVASFLVLPWVLGLRDLGVTWAAAGVVVLATAIFAALVWAFRTRLSLGAFRSLTRRGSRAAAAAKG